ncbi:dehydrogenase [Nocardioides sp. Root1257]|uniref:Gfo/Idh/MocA family protein n=1 Tax=unclassified Nocardioides TaxID=2615069 RepID=UPI0006F7B7AC|nr:MULTISPECIES: Gfo/Idh/MocA family oxidoreductase [unclassified Nocardioides]KQW47809.1 dehydrogenase [Nocardioides sp. Root1257]KRC45061.1 dehydrogenase [Nocardioides sp. Root224]
MSETLRVGLVGIGMMGRNHARVLSSLDGARLVAIADPAGDPHRAAGATPVVDTVTEMVERGIDMAVVATPTGFHLSAGLELAAAGIPTLIEKPLATDAHESQQLVDAFEGAGLVNAVGHIERCNPALLALRERLDHGDLGEIYQVATRRQGPFPHRIADVGVVKDLATHDIDLTAWVIRSQYRSVSAHSAHKSGRMHEDLISVTAQMEDGTVVSHLVNWLSPLKERVTVVTGERGAFVADTLTGDLTFHENGLIRTEWDQVATFRGVTEGNSTRFAIPKPEPLRVQHEHFRDAVLGVSDKVVTMREGLRTVAVADACLRSAQEGRTVEVSEVLA